MRDVQTKVKKDGTHYYVGISAPGKLTSEAVWQIRRITVLPGPDATIQYANGSTAWDSVWDSYASYTYSLA